MSKPTVTDDEVTRLFEAYLRADYECVRVFARTGTTLAAWNLALIERDRTCAAWAHALVDHLAGKVPK